MARFVDAGAGSAPIDTGTFPEPGGYGREAAGGLGAGSDDHRMGKPRMRISHLIAAALVGAVLATPAAASSFFDPVTRQWVDYSARGVPSGKSPIRRERVRYEGSYAPGTIIIDTSERRLYHVLPNGRAMKYGIGVGREGFPVGRHTAHLAQGRVAGLDAAAADARPRTCQGQDPSRAYARRPEQSARRARHVSRLVALPHPRFERALDDRHRRVRRAVSGWPMTTSFISTTMSTSERRWWSSAEPRDPLTKANTAEGPASRRPFLLPALFVAGFPVPPGVLSCCKRPRVKAGQGRTRC